VGRILFNGFSGFQIHDAAGSEIMAEKFEGIIKKPSYSAFGWMWFGFQSS